MTNLARMPNARELYKPGFVSVTHGVGPPSGFSSDVLRLAFTIYTDRELDDLGVFSYGRSIPTVDGQLAKLREGHVGEPTMRSALFGEWWQLAGDIAFDALTGPNHETIMSRFALGRYAAETGGYRTSKWMRSVPQLLFKAF